MEYRRLGNSGLRVSEISLGSWLTYGNYVDRSTAIKIIHRAFELGINFFDTANVYMQGEAERVVGDALSSFDRSSYVLATKVYFPMGDGPNDKGLSRKHITEQCHASLKRLQTDYLDIYYCHRFDEETPLEETLRTFDDLIRQGKILYVGVSEWKAEQILEARKIADKYMLDRIIVNQPRYNMFNRYIEDSVIPVAEKHDISQVVFSPLAQGVLTGKYKIGIKPPEDSRASDSESQQFIYRYLTDENLMKVEKLAGIAQSLGLTMPQLALAWVLRIPSVSSALVGASRPQQIEDNARASGIKLEEEVITKLEQIISG